MAAAIELSGLGKRFGSKDGEVVALEDVSLTIRPQEFVCFVGPSGCGKSTILGMVADLIAPSSGNVTVHGQSADAARRARQIGLVFQDAVLLPWRTVEENVALPLEVMGVARAERRRIVADILQLVKLEGFERRFPHELSGGMRQRLGIGRAFSFDPAILLMDEPFGALDAITRDRMSIELLRIHQQRQKTVLFVTHSIPEAVLLSDRVVVMSPRPGRVRAVVENPLPRPRDLSVRDAPEFGEMARHLRHLLQEE